MAIAAGVEVAMSFVIGFVLAVVAILVLAEAFGGELGSEDISE